MSRSILRRLLLLASLAGLPGAAQADNCAAMEDSGPKWFSAELDRAQATFQTGNSADAYEQLRQATMGLPRRADVSLEARCVGPDLWQRYYQLRRPITQSLGQAAEKVDKLANTHGALDWYVTGDNQADARRVIPKLTPTTNGTAWIIGRLRSEIGTLDHATTAGFKLLPEEQAARAFWQRGLDDTIRYARSKVSEVLQAETGLLTREANDEELKSEQAQKGVQSMAADFFGDPSLAPETEALRNTNRAKASLKMLKAAREWATAVSAEDAEPVNERALARGDTLMARAGGTEFGLESREALYQAADNYFEFAGNRERQLAVERNLAVLAPALKMERDQRNAKISEQAEKMKASAAEMKESMTKSETQKKSFKDEADAMEAELGF